MHWLEHGSARSWNILISCIFARNWGGHLSQSFIVYISNPGPTNGAYLVYIAFLVRSEYIAQNNDTAPFLFGHLSGVYNFSRDNLDEYLLPGNSKFALLEKCRN